MDARVVKLCKCRGMLDQQGLGLWFQLPHDTALGVNPTNILTDYIQNHSLANVKPEAFIFCSFQQYNKSYTSEPLSSAAWNKRFTQIQLAAEIPRRTSHGIRATAISLTPHDDLHTVAQVGGWRSMAYLTTYHRTPIDDRTRALHWQANFTLA